MNHLRNKDRCLPLLACLLLPFLAPLCPAQEAPNQKISAPLVDDLDDLKKIETQLVSVADRISPKIDGFPFALQHDIPLTPSQCGGPLLDMKGRCIGINVSRTSRVSALAIPASSVAGLLESSRPGIHAAGTKIDEVPPP